LAIKGTSPVFFIFGISERITDKIKLNSLFLEVVLMKKKFSGTEIVGKLRQAYIMIGRGKKSPKPHL